MAAFLLLNQVSGGKGGGGIYWPNDPKYCSHNWHVFSDMRPLERKCVDCGKHQLMTLDGWVLKQMAGGER